MKVSRRTFGGLVLGGTASLALPGLATAKAKFSFRMGSAFPATHPSSVFVAKALEAIKAETNGDVEILFFPTSQLGSDPDMLSQIRGGALDMLVQSGVTMSIVARDTAISAVPFVFENYEKVWTAMDGELGQYIRGVIAGMGLHAFTNIYDSGYRSMTSNGAPIASPADLKGKKFRVPPSPLWTDMFAALGASPTTIVLAELYSALQTGLVDGQENPLSQIFANRLYEVQKFCALTQHVWDGTWIMASNSVWERLPEDVQKVMSKHFDENALLQRANVAEQNDDLVKQMEAAGMSFSSPDQAAFRTALVDAGFYEQARTKFAPEAWSALEKSTGTL